ncbi:AvrD family protein [Verminephrobacter eiseniae]|uniref:AvrD family protein n=1 Tax=Verminephrobacter eiseniae TaxID=364317 RepID=UPI0022370955|nr:AvrD family protein [Verminephrobacter eiseniae]MCW5235644.1 hypothetical protein [Verminephrobacter eiseniae]
MPWHPQFQIFWRWISASKSVTNFRILKEPDQLSFVCTGQVRVPEVWSKKGTNHQTPHLSTIDVIELSIECLREFLNSTLHQSVISTGSIRRMSIVAGRKPVEGSLDDIDIFGKAKKEIDGSYVLELSIANMTLNITYAPTAYPGLPTVPRGKQPIIVGDVMINSGEGQSTASAVVTPLSICTDETWSISSCFAASLQLGQALLYNLDGMDRSQSNTLWMKRTTIEFSQELSRSTQLQQPIFTRLENERKYIKPDGEWRRADIVSVICNAKIICSVTHRLPFGEVGDDN